jgi:hypothetical protein
MMKQSPASELLAIQKKQIAKLFNFCLGFSKCFQR